MTNEQKLAENKIKLGQNAKDLAGVQAETSKLKAEMAEIEAKLEEAKKPVLRHGDYGFGSNWDKQNIDAFIYTKQTTDNKTFYASGMGQVDTISSKHPVIGNLFDDLKAMQTEVTECEVSCERFGGDKITATICGDKVIIDHVAGDETWISLEDFDKYVFELRQMQATLKRQQN
jgi:hypothetical protein